jgi:hypothetical protein
LRVFVTTHYINREVSPGEPAHDIIRDQEDIVFGDEHEFLEGFEEEAFHPIHLYQVLDMRDHMVVDAHEAHALVFALLSEGVDRVEGVSEFGVFLDHFEVEGVAQALAQNELG